MVLKIEAIGVNFVLSIDVMQDTENQDQDLHCVEKQLSLNTHGDSTIYI